MTETWHSNDQDHVLRRTVPNGYICLVVARAERVRVTLYSGARRLLNHSTDDREVVSLLFTIKDCRKSGLQDFNRLLKKYVTFWSLLET